MALFRVKVRRVYKVECDHVLSIRAYSQEEAVMKAFDTEASDFSKEVDRDLMTEKVLEIEQIDEEPEYEHE